MKITHINSPKAGITEHVRPDVGRVLVASGLAQEVPFPKRGGPGWLEAMAEQEAQRNPTTTHLVTWTVDAQPVSGKPAVVRRFGTEVFWYSAPPKECPAAIKKQFEALVAAKEPALIAAAEQRLTAERAQASSERASRVLMRVLGIEPNN